MSHLPGLSMVAGVAMGIGAMSAVMLSLPLTSVLLSALLLGADGLAVTPLVNVAVIVAYVAATRMTPDDKTTRPGLPSRPPRRARRPLPARTAWARLESRRDGGATATARAPVPAEEVFAPG